MAKPSSEEFQQITQELYKKNLDLVNANKELALIQKLYEIITRTLTIEDVAQQFIDVIVKDLGFLAGAVALKDRGSNHLRAVAATKTQFYKPAFKLIGSDLSNLKVSLNNKQNLLIKSYRTQKRLSTQGLHEILTPLVDEETAIKISQMSKVKHTLIYPLGFGKRTLGVFTISLDRDLKDLTEHEKKILNRVATIFGVAIDRIMIYQDLRRLNKKLKDFNKLKDEFLSIAGHELRTPMTAIKSYLWMLLNKKQKGDKISRKTQQYIDRAFQSTERLISLVNDMLDVSRIEGGRVVLNPEALNIFELAYEVKTEVAAKLKENKLELLVKSATKKPIVWADKNKTHQVLLNLVGNSLKFTPVGGKITISLNRIDHHVEIAIVDTGKGISKEDMSRLFTKFGRLEGTYTSIAATKGTGLGLYLCKQYVELQGGKISVESEVGKGTTFTFTLPVAGKKGEK